MQRASSHIAEKRYCACCQQLVSISTAYRHRRLQAPPRLKAGSPFTHHDALVRPGQPSDGGATRNYELLAQADAELTVEEFCEPAGAAGCESIDDESANPTAIVQDVMLKVSTEWARVISPENSEDEDDGSGCSSKSSEESTELDLRDQLGEGFERDLMAVGEL
jgi:hypothetical protein